MKKMGNLFNRALILKSKETYNKSGVYSVLCSANADNFFSVPSIYNNEKALDSNPLSEERERERERERET